MAAWGFRYKANIVWQKVRKDGGPDGRGVGFYFRDVTELLLFGVRGKNARTLQPGRTQVDTIATRMREHSRKPNEQYPLITSCSPGPYLELFARGERPGWTIWGDPAHEGYAPDWPNYAHHSQRDRGFHEPAESGLVVRQSTEFTPSPPRATPSYIPPAATRTTPPPPPPRPPRHPSSRSPDATSREPLRGHG